MIYKVLNDKLNHQLHKISNINCPLIARLMKITHCFIQSFIRLIIFHFSLIGNADYVHFFVNFIFIFNFDICIILKQIF